MTGDVLGSHAGQHLFTVGQRRGVGVANGEPLYVLEKDAEPQPRRRRTRDELAARRRGAAGRAPASRRRRVDRVKLRYRAAPLPAADRRRARLWPPSRGGGHARRRRRRSGARTARVPARWRPRRRLGHDRRAAVDRLAPDREVQGPSDRGHCASLLALASACWRSMVHPRAPRAPSARIAVISPGSWCWFGDPRAIEMRGLLDQIVVGWIGPTGAVTVASYDPRLGVPPHPVVGHLVPGRPQQPVSVRSSPTSGSRCSSPDTTAPRCTTARPTRPGDISAWGPSHAVPSAPLRTDGLHLSESGLPVGRAERAVSVLRAARTGALTTSPGRRPATGAASTG